MVERKVPRDIRKFKGKVIGSFGLRQVVCIGFASMVDLFVYKTFISGSGLSDDTRILIMMLCALPIMIFILEPNGMPMEQYLTKVLYKNIMYPTKRKVKTNLNTYKYEKSANEIKKINKEYQKRIKEEPEWKMFE